MHTAMQKPAQNGQKHVPIHAEHLLYFFSFSLYLSRAAIHTVTDSGSVRKLLKTQCVNGSDVLDKLSDLTSRDAMIFCWLIGMMFCVIAWASSIACKVTVCGSTACHSAIWRTSNVCRVALICPCKIHNYWNAWDAYQYKVISWYWGCGSPSIHTWSKVDQ